MNIKVYAIKDKNTGNFLSKNDYWNNDRYLPRFFNKISHIKNHFNQKNRERHAWGQSPIYLGNFEIVTFEVKETGEVIDGSSLKERF